MRKATLRKWNLGIDLAFVGILIALIVGGRLLSGPNEEENGSESGQLQEIRILEPEEEISALYTDGDQVYVGTNRGIHVYDAKTCEMRWQIDGIRMIYTASIIGDGAGGVWIGHEDGLTHLDATGKQELFAAPKLPEGRVNAIAEKDGKLYCGTYNGAAVLEETASGWKVVQRLDQKSGLLCDSVNVILSLEDGILFGSYLASDGGISILSEDGTFQYLDVSSGLPHPYITSAICGENGSIFVGMGYMRDGALAELSPGKDGYEIRKVYTKADGIPGEKVRYLFQDSESFWLTTEYDGVVIRKKKTGQTSYLTEETGLSDNEIKCVTKAAGAYWLGGKYGLTVIPASELE